MAFLQVQFFSEALEVQSPINVILPEPAVGVGMKAAKANEPAKVLYLLHGYSDDHTIWMRRTSVERYAAAYNLAVIMPAVNHSFYTNEQYGERYWDYVSEELPMVAHRFFHLSDKAEDTFVAGLSMGGYGALKLGLTHPERFAAVGCFSGAADIVEMARSWQKERRSLGERVFGDLSKLEGSDADLLHLLKKNGQAPKKPKLYISCGTADFLYGAHEKIWPLAEKCGWDVTHHEIPGAIHEWGLWDSEIRFFIPWALEGKTER